MSFVFFIRQVNCLLSSSSRFFSSTCDTLWVYVYRHWYIDTHTQTVRITYFLTSLFSLVYFMAFFCQNETKQQQKLPNISQWGIQLTVFFSDFFRIYVYLCLYVFFGGSRDSQIGAFGVEHTLWDALIEVLRYDGVFFVLGSLNGFRFFVKSEIVSFFSIRTHERDGS